jgi:hypothetical protein
MPKSKRSSESEAIVCWYRAVTSWKCARELREMLCACRQLSSSCRYGEAVCVCRQRNRECLDLDLETYHVAVVRALGHDGDDAESIGESSSVLFVVGDLKLKFGPHLHSLTHPVNGNLVGAFHSIGRVPQLAGRDLKETAVASHDFVQGVSGHVAKGFGSVYDRAIGLLEITHDEGDRAVDRTKLDLGTGSRDYLKKDRHHVETSG